MNKNMEAFLAAVVLVNFGLFFCGLLIGLMSLTATAEHRRIKCNEFKQGPHSYISYAAYSWTVGEVFGCFLTEPRFNLANKDE